MIGAVRGEDHTKLGMRPDQVDTIKDRFMEYLHPQTIEETSMDDLINILNPSNPIERIAYRKKATISNKHEFVRVGKNTKGQF